MAVVDILPAATAAGTSTSFDCDGIAAITVGIYTDSNVPFVDRVGAKLQVNNPDGYEDFRDDDGNMVVLSPAKPMYAVTQTGTYQVVKSATTAAVGVFSDDGT